jgi:hypothetical protein
MIKLVRKVKIVMYSIELSFANDIYWFLKIITK